MIDRDHQFKRLLRQTVFTEHDHLKFSSEKTCDGQVLSFRQDCAHAITARQVTAEELEAVTCDRTLSLTGFDKRSLQL